MELEFFALARALHVVSIVAWIGGVAFVTTVLIPALINIPDGGSRLALFERLEGRFALQAKLTTLVAGLSGLYMLEVLVAWGRYTLVSFWWMHLMTLVWFVFTIVLFVAEPLFLHRYFHQLAMRDSNRAFRVLFRMHKLLLTISLVAVLGAVMGSHGVSLI